VKIHSSNYRSNIQESKFILCISQYCPFILVTYSTAPDVKNCLEYHFVNNAFLDIFSFKSSCPPDAQKRITVNTGQVVFSGEILCYWPQLTKSLVKIVFLCIIYCITNAVAVLYSRLRSYMCGPLSSWGVWCCHYKKYGEIEYDIIHNHLLLIFTNWTCTSLGYPVFSD